jgi:hypothetical protein
MLNYHDSIYCLGKPDYSINGKKIVAVHPYHFGFVTDNRVNRKSYPEQIDRFFSSHAGPLIILEVPEKIQKTAEHLVSLGRKSRTYFVGLDDIALDFDLPWNYFFNFLDSFPSKKPVGLVGGIYWWSEGPNFDFPGCLGEVERIFKNNYKKPFKLMKNLTFTFSGNCYS